MQLRFLRHLSIFLTASFAVGALPAQEWNRAIRSLRPADVRDEEKTVLDNLQRRAENALAGVPRAYTRQEADKARSALRHQLQQSLGLHLFQSPPVLKARVVGTLSREGYRIEKIVYETQLGTVPAHLYLPAGVAQPGPAVLFYPGHWWPDAKTRPDFQAFCINMARMGFGVLIWDPFGQGERGISMRDHRRVEALLIGISQQGFAEYETQCALTYLLSRKEVDPHRIGMTGASGGGYNTWITAALDDRVAAAVPVVGTSEFFQQISVTRSYNWDPNEHCHYVPGLIRYANNHELLAMAAPRPIRVIAARDDREFPITGVRSIYEYGHQLYTSYGSPERISLIDDTSAGHGYQQKKREAAYGWFLRWLMHRGDGNAHPEPPTVTMPYDAPELRCFPAGQNQPAGPGIVELVRRLAADLPLPTASRNLSAVLGLPSDKLLAHPAVQSVQLQRLLIGSEKEITLPAFLLRPKGNVKGVLIAVDDRGKEALTEDLRFPLLLNEQWAVCGMDPRGIGELSTTKMAWVAAVSLLLNENFVGRQAFDIGRVVKYLGSDAAFAGKPFTLYARGHTAALAAAYVIGLSSDLKYFLLRDGFISLCQFLERPHSLKLSFKLQTTDQYTAVPLEREIPFQYFPFCGLRYFDVPQLLASTQATGLIVNPIDGDWNRMSETNARRSLPSRIRILSDDHPDNAITEFLRNLIKGASSLTAYKSSCCSGTCGVRPGG